MFQYKYDFNILILFLILCLINGKLLKNRVGHDYNLDPEIKMHIHHEMQLYSPENTYFNLDPIYQITNVEGVDGSDIHNLKNNQVVRVSYQTNPVNASDNDFIILMDADQSPDHKIPIKMAWCNNSRDTHYINTGIGNLHINITNTRRNLTFYYMTNGNRQYKFSDGTWGMEQPGQSDNPKYWQYVVAKWDYNMSWATDGEPLRGRVLADDTRDNSAFTVSWSTGEAGKTNAVMEYSWSSVANGDATSYLYSVPATSSKIERESLCGAPANTTGWRDLGYIMSAPINNADWSINPKIYYRFGVNDGNPLHMSSEHVFNVPPPAGQKSTSRPTKVILYDDLGRGGLDDAETWGEYGTPSIYTTMSVNEEILQGEVDAVYHGGDISYAEGYMASWDFFMDQISPLATRVPYLITLGNHESNYPNTASIFNGTDSRGECGVLASSLLPMPWPAIKDKPWWYYDVGMMRLVGMSTEHDFSIGSEQYLFLEQALSSVDRSKTPWIIFGGHRPMYINSLWGPCPQAYTDPDDQYWNTNCGGQDSDQKVANMLIYNVEPLLVKYNVDLAFWGHNHQVQRQSSVQNRTTCQASTPITDSDGNVVHTFEDPPCPVHMVVGTGGASFSNTSPKSPSSPDWIEFFPWSEMNMQEYGYATVTAADENRLVWEFKGSTLDNEVLDRMTICKNNINCLGSTADDNSDNDDVDYNPIIISVTVVGAVVAIVGYLVYTGRFTTSKGNSRSSSASTNNHVEINAPLTHEESSSA